MRTREQKTVYMRERSRRLRSQGLCVACGKVKTDKSRCDRCRAREYTAASKPHRKEKAKANHRNWYVRYKEAIFNHYGNACAWCGSTVKEFLTIDHIDNDGAEHRRKFKNLGTSYFKSIIDEGFPKNLQLLCYNCNCSKQYANVTKQQVLDKLRNTATFTDGAGI